MGHLLCFNDSFEHRVRGMLMLDLWRLERRAAERRLTEALIRSL
ncbi:MAG: hypothetical protein VYD19_00640 [Myxococcota bacterium]|nr:hypothetical protein [Myxococcota bacterium]